MKKKESMGVQQVICMKGGVGEGSYARNSKSQVGFSLSLSLCLRFFVKGRPAPLMVSLNSLTAFRCPWHQRAQLEYAS